MIPIDYAIVLDRVLTPDERRAALTSFCVVNPHWRGAHVADVLSELHSVDAYLPVIEPMYEQHGGDVPEPGLLSYATLAAVLLHGFDVMTIADDETKWNHVRELVERARRFDHGAYVGLLTAGTAMPPTGPWIAGATP